MSASFWQFVGLAWVLAICPLLQGCTPLIPPVDDSQDKIHPGAIRVPVYGEFATTAQVGPLREALEEVEVGTRCTIELDGQYKTNVARIFSVAESREKVTTDPIHIFRLPFRDVLSYEEMRPYPFLLLGWIDVESTEGLVRYLREGGFALMAIDQLDLVQEYFAERQSGQEGESLKRVEIWSGHPLMEVHYPMRNYPRKTDEMPPLQGLEQDGRLVAVASSLPRADAFSGISGAHQLYGTREENRRLFVNIAIYGLKQSREGNASPDR